MEKIILGDIERHLMNKVLIRYSQHGFMKEKPCLSNLISFCDKVTHIVDEGEMAYVIFLNPCKPFGTIPHSILLDRLSDCDTKRYIVHGVMNWLDGGA